MSDQNTNRERLLKSNTQSSISKPKRTRRTVLKLAAATGFTISGSTIVSANDGEQSKNRASESNKLIELAWLQGSFVHRFRNAHKAVTAPEGFQFLFVSFKTGVNASNASLDLGGSTVEVDESLGPVGLEEVVLTPPDDIGPGPVVAFAIPRDIEATKSNIRLANGTVSQLEPGFTEQVSRPAELELLDFSVPDESEAYGRFPVRAKVRNTGGRDETFFGVVRIKGPSSYRKIVSGTVPTGAETEIEANVLYPEAGELTLVLGDGRKEIDDTVVITD